MEIKVTVMADGIPPAAKAFELDRAEKQRRTIYFYEDLAGPDGPAGLPLLNHGIILRLRRNKGRRDDVTAKLRPCKEPQLTQRWINARKDEEWNFRVEGDWAGPRHVVAASLEAKIEDGVFDAVVAEGHGVPLVSAQRTFLEDCARVPVALSRLSPLGPIDGTKWELSRNGQKIFAEQWVVGDGLRFLELSTRVEPEEAPAAQQAFEDLFREYDINLDPLQETKTRMVLEYFAARAGAQRRLTPRLWPTVVLIRHADVTSGAGTDPPLNATGTARAQELKHVLGRSGITAIFVTSLQRTQATAKPLAEGLGLQPTVLDDPAHVVEAIRTLPGFTTVLVVGHSNTIPDLVVRLGGPTITPIAANEFERLLIVTNGRLCNLRYGQEAP
ncbi:SixA phosphatase family protein [[Micrococcus luteus] ATCC 49442]|uniref:SixA phosphatase family protein n=1 Tax=[Micrococcus luteus] ATCC 49442 TaxID=2698727 RepID=UPI0013D958BC|nr:histidine phosphatase family protein [[Micrococcus luteus] ATCC 49442]